MRQYVTGMLDVVNFVQKGLLKDYWSVFVFFFAVNTFLHGENDRVVLNSLIFLIKQL